MTNGSFHFKNSENGRIFASIYLHGDCYLSGDSDYGGDTRLKAFFDAVKKQCDNDTRFDDPSYLAAKFVVWESGSNGKLNFLGIGVTDPEHREPYNYFIVCDNDKMPWFYVEDEDGKRIFSSKEVENPVLTIEYKKSNGQIDTYKLTRIDRFDAEYIEGIVRGKGFRKFIRKNVRVLK